MITSQNRMAFWCISFFLSGFFAWSFFCFLSRLDRSILFGEPVLLQSVSEEVVVLATPDFEPADVVRLQVESLRAGVKNPEALRACFELASPENRELTGPFERFAVLVTSDPYSRIGTSSSWQIGRTIIEGNFASLLVTTVGADGAANAFRFLLEKQYDIPYEDCWMTVSVQIIAAQSVQTTSSSNER